MYPAGASNADIRAAMASIDGPALPAAGYVFAHWARDIGLKRPAKDEEPWRTAERRAVLEETWAAGVDVDVIAARMRALPGGPVLDARIAVWAAQLDLQRPPEHQARLARARTERIRGTRWVRKPDDEEHDTGAGVASTDAGPPGVAGRSESDMAAEGARGDGPAPQQEPQAGGEAPLEGDRPPAPPEPPADQTAAAPKVAALVGPGEAVAVSEAPPPPQPSPASAPRPAAPKLPAASNGKVYASFREIKAWAGHFGIAYNGANIAASMLLRNTGVLHGAVLLSPMLPFEPDAVAQLAGVRVFLGAGRLDPLVPAAQVDRLAELLRQGGADVTVHWTPGGHTITPDEFAAAQRWVRAGRPVTG
jgi:hypothetical protein